MRNRLIYRWPIYVALLWTLVGAEICRADSTKALLLAARSADLPEVRRLIEADVSANASDDWGTTPLHLAAKVNAVDVVRYLLEQGADPSARETFFGMSVLSTAIVNGGPDYEVAKILLRAGANDRESALHYALSQGNLDLARTAVASGPFLESKATELKNRFAALEGDLQTLLTNLKTRPDPPPPHYSAEQLAEFADTFESPEGVSAVVEKRDGRLLLIFDERTAPLTAIAERTFHDPEGNVTVQYLGRAGMIEGIAISRPDQPPIRMPPAETDILDAADLPTQVAVAGDPKKTVHWPSFRGVNRSGIGDGIDPPVEIDLISGRGVAWRAEIGGLGNSSPVVWRNRVFVTTAEAEGGNEPLRVGLTGAPDEIDEDAEHRWRVLAFDKSDGRKLWQNEIGRGRPLTRRHFKATQANSTPVTDGEHVVVVFPTAGLACLSTDGELRWHLPLGGLNAGGFNDPGMQWGFAASPIIYQDKVILQVDIHEGAYLAAWDLKTGRSLWRTERPNIAPSWATPTIWPIPTGDELVVNASIIRGYDPDDGRELWSLGPTSIQVVSSPVVGPRNLFVSAGYPPLRPIYAIRPGIRGQHIIDSGEINDVLAWHRTRGGSYMPTPLLYQGLLYLVHHNGRLVAHDPQTGIPVYRARFSKGGTMTASPVAANGKIYQGSEQGQLYVLAAGPEYRELAIHDIGAPLMATPAISEGLLLVRTPTELFAFGNVRQPPETP